MTSCHDVTSDNIIQKLVLRHKMQMQTQQRRLSATVGLGTQQMCLQHTLETQQDIELSCKSLGRDHLLNGSHEPWL